MGKNRVLPLLKPTAWIFGLKLKLEYFWSNDPNETPDKVRYRQVGKFPRRIMIHATQCSPKVFNCQKIAFKRDIHG